MCVANMLRFDIHMHIIMRTMSSMYSENQVLGFISLPHSVLTSSNFIFIFYFSSSNVLCLCFNNYFFVKQRFAAVIMRIREPKTTALIFASGKMVSLTSISVMLCMFFLSTSSVPKRKRF